MYSLSYSRNHILQGIVKGLKVWIDLVLHVAGEEAEFFSGLHGRAREDYLPRLAVLECAHGQGYGDIGFAGTGRPQGESEVVCVESLDKLGLVGSACADGLAVDSVDYGAVGLALAWSFALYDVDNHILGQCVVLLGIVAELPDMCLEFGGLALFAYDPHNRTTGRNPQFGE